MGGVAYLVLNYITFYDSDPEIRVFKGAEIVLSGILIASSLPLVLTHIGGG